MENLLTVLVGSRAHGLHTPTSDYDYRSVYIRPTVDFIKLYENGKVGKFNDWKENENVDDTAYEIGHFLHLATKSNPPTLEMFVAPLAPPISIRGSDTSKLLDLFQSVWSSKDVYHAFNGYSRNQQTKLFSDKPEYTVRKWKYATAYLRVLIMGIQLLESGTMSLEVPEEWKSYLISVRNGDINLGAVVDAAYILRGRLENAYNNNPDKQTDLESVNDFLVDIRKKHYYL